MKKIICILTALLLVIAALPAAADSRYTVLRVAYPEGEALFADDYESYSNIALRFTDTGRPIPMSVYMDGTVYAAVPPEDAERPVEVFITEKKKFADYDEDFDEPFWQYAAQKLSGYGVLYGDENGNANVSDNVTRAEATAMIMRLIGMESTENAGTVFADVPADAWFSGIVKKAYDAGIVRGDSADTFSPYREISREEATVMIARAVWHTGLREEKPTTYDELYEEMSYDDAGIVSEWALNAYGLFDYLAISDMVYIDENSITDEPVEEPYWCNFLKPQQEATRGEIAELIMWAREMPVFPLTTAVEYGFDSGMPVIDGSTSTYPFTEAVYGHLFYNGFYHPQRPAMHSKTHASYEKLINGETDVVFGGVEPAQDILELAASKDVELEITPIAHDAMVFFTNAENLVDSLTTEQLREIYIQNKHTNWSTLGGGDEGLYPYCRNTDSGSHALMEKFILNGSSINPEIYSESISSEMQNIITDVMDVPYNNENSFGLGYSVYYYYKNMTEVFYDTNSLKMLAIDGVMPSDESIADGTYPFASNAYIVIRHDEPENSPARRMVEFILSGEGQECIEYAGFGRIK